MTSTSFDYGNSPHDVRRLQNSSVDDLTVSNDSTVVRETLRAYGSLYAGALLLFCILRLKYPKLYNIRSWAPDHECDLAKREYGFFNWMWKITAISDAEILDQCGMDALCFLRALRFGRNIALVGCLNALWLMPLYATAKSSPETDYLTDAFALISIANLPSSSKRFLGTVLAAYVTFGYTMYAIFHEYVWYTANRHEFLRQARPSSYAVYVSGIPERYRSSFALAQYFGRGGDGDHVLEAHVAVDTPNLDAKVARRALVLRKLERAAVSLGQERSSRRLLVDSRRRLERLTDSWLTELHDLNLQITRAIGSIQSKNDPFRSRLVRMDASLKLDLMNALSNDNDSEEEESSDWEPSVTDSSACIEAVESILSEPDRPPNNSSNEGSAQSTESVTIVAKKRPPRPGMPKKRPTRQTHEARGATKRNRSVSKSIDASKRAVQHGIGSATTRIAQSSIAASTTIAKHSRRAGQTIRKVTKEVGMEKALQSAGVQGARGLKTAQYVGSNLVSSVGTVLPILLNKDEGAAREAGFVVFNTLYAAQMALQVLHHHKPNVMDVQEAPDPRDIFWRNVGMPAHGRRTGALAAFGASAVLCFFYTIPITCTLRSFSVW